MKVRNRILLLSSLLLLVSIGGIGNLVWQIPRFDQMQDLKTVLHALMLLGLFGAGLIFSVLELVRHEIISPIFQLAGQISRLKDRKIDGHRLELTGSKDIDLLTSAFNDLLDGFEKEENLYRMFTEMSPDMIFLLDRDGRVLFANSNAARQWNYQSEEIIGKRQEELFPPDIAARHKQAVEKIFGSGQPIFTDLHETIGQHKCWIDARMVPILDENSRVRAVLGISRDITERKRAESLLQQEHATLNSIIDLNPYGIQIFDAEGHYLRSNQAFFNMFQAVPPADYCIFDDPIVKKAGFHEKVHLAVQEGKAHMNPEAWYNPHWLYPELPDKLSCFRSTVFPIMNAEGKMDSFVVMFEDTTERKRAEESLRESEEIFNQFLKHSPIYVFFKDENIKAVRLSENFTKMLGRPIGELLGKDMDDLFPSDLSKSMVADDRRVLREGRKIEIEEELNGRVYSTIKFPLHREGKPTCLAGFTIDVTERKQAERKILELSKFPSENPSPVLRIAQDGKILYSNTPGLELLAHWNVKVGEKAPGKWRRLIKETLESARPGLQEEEEEEEEEEEVKSNIFSIVISPVIEAGYVNLYGRDITGRRRAEMKLAASEERYRQLINNTNDIIYSLTPEGIFTFVSSAWTRLLGHAPAEVVGQSFAGFVHPDDLPLCYAFLQKVVKSGERQEGVEYRVRHKNGEWRWHTSSAAPIKDAAGAAIGYDGLARDITARKQAEAKAVMLSGAIENAHHGCLIIAGNYKVIFGNDYALTKLGFDPVELKNIDLFSICADREQIKDIIETMKVTRRWMGEIAVTKKDGKQFPALVSITALGADDDASGRDGNVILFQDITIQKEMREKLLTSEKLAVMGRLTADVAHELNNPLAIVIGGTQLVLSRMDEKAQTTFKSQIETVLRNARRCKTILSNLLGYGRTIGKKEEAVNLPDLIREAIDDVNYQHDMSAIETVLNYGEIANAEITGNRSALLSVFVNLIRNARQAMGEKGRLTVTIEKEDAKHLRIEIHDTGIGMNKEQKTKLFKPFVSGWKEGEGSGLGLATSLGIIETHGGSMSAESAGEGKGTTFTIILPCEFKEKK